MEEEVKASSSSSLDPKLAALLCWIFAPITSLIFMLMDDTKKDEFIMFNAKESLWYGVVQIVLSFSLVVTIIPVIGWLISCVVGIIQFAMMIGRIVIGVKAYNGEKVVLPVLGDIASK
jgi:uncharacterized membrane protein